MTRDRERRISELERLIPTRQAGRFTAWAESLSDDELNHAVDLAMRRYHGLPLTVNERAEMAAWPAVTDRLDMSDAELDGRIAELEAEARAIGRKDGKCR